MKFRASLFLDKVKKQVSF